MRYNIEFQIAGLIVTLILTIVFFSKKRWPSPQNSVYRVLLLITDIELALDIASVITITERARVPLLNDILSYAYLVVMISYIFCVDIYALANCFYSGIPRWRRNLKFIEAGALGAFYVFSLAVIFTHELLYGGEGKYIYSYGTPSDIIYLFSTVSVVFVILLLLLNIKRIPPLRQGSIYTFCIMEGIVAIVQMYNKYLLIVGFGTAAAVLSMYFTLENPDMHLIARLNEANRRTRDLLLNILPEKIADKLFTAKSTFTQTFEDVTIMFLDIAGFSKLSNQIGTEKIVLLLNDFFSQIDRLLDGYRIEKIKTIGDSYMVAAGVPEYYEHNCEETVRFAKAVLKLLDEFNRKNKTHIQIRIGINNGTVVAGIIGKKKFAYDLWGVDVNLASRMESSGKPGRIQVSEAAHKKLLDSFAFERARTVDIKGFGKVKAWLVK